MDIFMCIFDLYLSFNNINLINLVLFFSRMKRAVIWGFFVLLLIPLVFAGQSTDIDFSFESTQAVYMEEGDEVRFELNGDTHAIYVDDISSSAVKFRIAPTLSNTSRTYLAYVSLDTISKIDLEKDGVDDLNVALYAVDDEGVATMVFQTTSDNVITGEVGVVDEVGSNKNTYLTVIGVVVGVLILILLFVNMGKGKEESSEVKEEPKEEVKEEVPKED
jgi:hypothetical protein